MPLAVIGWLVFLDIGLAYLPHLFVGDINETENEIFVTERKLELTPVETDREADSIAGIAARLRKLIRKRKKLIFLRNLLYSTLIISAVIKLFFFFQTYPFFNTYQAYIVMTTYALGALLHIFCTGHILMYWRFRFRLKTDQNQFENSDGKIHDYSETQKKASSIQ